MNSRPQPVMILVSVLKVTYIPFTASLQSTHLLWKRYYCIAHLVKCLRVTEVSKVSVQELSFLSASIENLVFQVTLFNKHVQQRNSNLVPRLPLPTGKIHEKWEGAWYMKSREDQTVSISDVIQGICMSRPLYYVMHNSIAYI